MTFNPLIISFDESPEDIPVLLVGHKNIFNFGTGPVFTIDNMITGTKAVEIWNYLTGKNKEFNDD